MAEPHLPALRVIAAKSDVSQERATKLLARVVVMRDGTAARRWDGGSLTRDRALASPGSPVATAVLAWCRARRAGGITGGGDVVTDHDDDKWGGQPHLVAPALVEVERSLALVRHGRPRQLSLEDRDDGSEGEA